MAIRSVDRPPEYEWVLHTAFRFQLNFVSVGEFFAPGLLSKLSSCGPVRDGHQPQFSTSTL
eukprot:2190352-Amphidinium_carterae.1